MTGRPQRESPKQTCRLCIGEDVFQALGPLIKTSEHEFSSLSQLVETIIFLSEHIYIAEPDDSFAIGLAELKSRRVVAQIEDRALMESRFIHVTLDEKAIGFLDLLIEKYPMLFKTRSECAELLFLDILQSCTTPKELRYMINRLVDVLGLHPTHAASTRQAVI